MVQADNKKLQTQAANNSLLSAEQIEHGTEHVIDAIKGNDLEGEKRKEGNDHVVLEQLIEHGFPVEHKIGPYTLLQFAVVHSPGFEVVQVLLKYGANLCAKTMDGRNIVHLCCRCNRQDMPQGLWNYLSEQDLQHLMFERTNAGITPFMMAVQSGNYEVIKSCIKAQMYCNDEDSLGHTCTALAGKSNTDRAENQQFVQLLLAYIQANPQLPADIQTVRDMQQSDLFGEFVETSRSAQQIAAQRGDFSVKGVAQLNEAFMVLQQNQVKQ